LPSMRLPVEPPSIETPSWLLPEIRLRAPGVVPPSVVLFTPGLKMSTPVLWASAAVPVAFVPIMLPSIR
jgi:hypothetical protein